MIGIFELILLLCLMVCFAYIFWLHHNMKNGTSAKLQPKFRKRIQQEKIENDDDEILDNISLFKNNDNVSINSDDLFANDTKSSTSNSQ